MATAGDGPGHSRRRLVDYVVVLGYDRDRFRRRRRRNGTALELSPGAGGGQAGGKVLQRFPAKAWKDAPFIGKTSSLL